MIEVGSEWHTKGMPSDELEVMTVSIECDCVKYCYINYNDKYCEEEVSVEHFLDTFEPVKK